MRLKVAYCKCSDSLAEINSEFLSSQPIEIGKQSLNFSQATLNGLVDGIIVFDCQQNICQYNRKFIEMWNIEEIMLVTMDYDGLLAMMTKELKNPKDYIAKDKKINANQEQESCDDFEFKDGTIVARYSKPQYFEGRVVGRVISFRDVTRYKELEKGMAHLEDMKAILEIAAAVGHEVRNPLTTIRGFLQMLLNKKECIRQWEYYALMIEELDCANGIITEFLSIAKENVSADEKQELNNKYI